MIAPDQALVAPAIRLSELRENEPPTGKAPDYSNKDVFADPNPVPALQEEMDKARLVESS